MRIGILLRSMVAFLQNTSTVPGADPVRVFLFVRRAQPPSTTQPSCNRKHIHNLSFQASISGSYTFLRRTEFPAPGLEPSVQSGRPDSNRRPPEPHSIQLMRHFRQEHVQITGGAHDLPFLPYEHAGICRPEKAQYPAQSTHEAAQLPQAIRSRFSPPGKAHFSSTVEVRRELRTVCSEYAGPCLCCGGPTSAYPTLVAGLTIRRPQTSAGMGA